MTSKRSKPLSWKPEASQAFQILKEAFSAAPTLLSVEVDVFTTGVAAVLSQRQREPPHLHLCAFFSRKMSPAEQNYDIGDQELLAIKLYLEKWRHWLEGANHPFTVFTDHRNLEYLREAKRLKPWQARWAMFFTGFNFVITYRPGSKNMKPDAISHQFPVPLLCDMHYSDIQYLLTLCELSVHCAAVYRDQKTSFVFRR